MQITMYDLDGVAGPKAELRKDSQANLWLNDQPVLAVSVWERYVALTLVSRIVLVEARDYRRAARVSGFLCEHY